MEVAAFDSDITAEMTMFITATHDRLDYMVIIAFVCRQLEMRFAMIQVVCGIFHRDLRTIQVSQN